MRCAFPIALPLILLALACPKSAARPPASDLAATAARALFTEHRRALPRVPVQVPYPMDEKYWTYARGIDLPPRAELLQELRSAFATAPEPERYVIARHLLELGAPPADSDLAALDRRMAAFLRGESSVEDLPNIRVFLDYLHARRKQLELGPFLAQFQHGEPLLITVDPDDTAAGFERYARAQRDLLRLRMVAMAATTYEVDSHHGMDQLLGPLQAIAADQSAHAAFRVEAARAVYGMWDEGIRDLLVYLSFHDEEAQARYGWATHAAMADLGLSDDFEDLKDAWAAADEATKPAYLAVLARYGRPEILPEVIAAIGAGLPRLQAPQTSPSEPVGGEEQARATGPGFYLAQHGGPPPESEAPSAANDTSNPHALDPADMAGLSGYDPEDEDAAQRIRLLEHFDPQHVQEDALPVLHEALLKGGPAVRIACGELLATRGHASSRDLLRVTWGDEDDPLVLAELAHAYLMLGQPAEEGDVATDPSATPERRPE